MERIGNGDIPVTRPSQAKPYNPAQLRVADLALGNALVEDEFVADLGRVTTTFQLDAAFVSGLRTA